jgi:ankyrin repeat protein
MPTASIPKPLDCVSMQYPDLSAKLNEAITKHPERCEALLDQGADIDTVYAFGVTPLHIAVQYSRPEICRLLVERGANMEARTSDGFSAMDFAVMYGRMDIARLFIELNPVAIDSRPGGKSLEVIAADSDEPEMARMIAAHRTERAIRCAISNNNASPTACLTRTLSPL